MTKATILFADNNSDFLTTRSEFLERYGYRIISCSEPQEAKHILEQNQIDLAILDLRLLNDKDTKDISGLKVAQESVSTVPKIILTQYPTLEAAREALGPALDGLPPAVDFVAKRDGTQALLTAVRKALNLSTRFQDKVDDLSGQIRADYEDARYQAKINFWASLGVAIVGIAILVAGIALAMAEVVEVGGLTALAGLMTEAISYLFFQRADKANTRMDRYHLELLETRRLENLLAAGDELQSLDHRERSKESVIQAATRRWLMNSITLPKKEAQGGEA